MCPSAQDATSQAAELAERQGLIAQINHTNAGTRLSTGESVTEALARRDALALRQGALRAAIRAATNDGLPRYSRSEIRMVRPDPGSRDSRRRSTRSQRNSASWTRCSKGTTGPRR
jgi:hypothetical protein